MYMEYTKESIMSYIMRETGCNEAQANVVYRAAFDYGHSEGMSEVYWYATELCDMINSFMILK